MQQQFFKYMKATYYVREAAKRYFFSGPAIKKEGIFLEPLNKFRRILWALSY